MAITNGKAGQARTQRAPRGTVWESNMEVITLASPAEVLEYEISDANRGHAVLEGHASNVKMAHAGGWGPEWYGADGVTPAIEALKLDLAQGWKDGTQRMVEAREALSGTVLTMPLNRKARMTHEHTSGPFINVGRAVRHDPFAYSRWERKAVPAVTQIVVSIGGNAMQGPEQLIWKGVVAMVISDMLTEAGYRTAVTAIDPTTWGQWTNMAAKKAAQYWLVTRVDVKRADEPLVLDLLASVTANPRFFRAGLIPAMAEFKIRVPSDLGNSKALSAEQFAHPDLADLADAVKISHNVFDKASAIAEINRLVAQLNGEEQNG